MEVDAPDVVQRLDLTLAIADGPGQRKRFRQQAERGGVMPLVELRDGKKLDRVRLAAPVPDRTMDVDRLASPRGRGLVLSLRRRDLAQGPESGAQAGWIGRAQLWKQRLVGVLRFAKRATLLQPPRVVERERRAALCRSRQQ